MYFVLLEVTGFGGALLRILDLHGGDFSFAYEE